MQGGIIPPMHLSAYLSKRGIGQNEFARESGIPQSQICRWVTYGREPTLRQALRLFQATGGAVGLLDMLQGDPPEGVAELVASNPAALVGEPDPRTSEMAT